MRSCVAPCVVQVRHLPEAQVAGTVVWGLCGSTGCQTQMAGKGHGSTGWYWRGGAGKINFQDGVEQSLGLRGDHE